MKEQLIPQLNIDMAIDMSTKTHNIGGGYYLSLAELYKNQAAIMVALNKLYNEMPKRGYES